MPDVVKVVRADDGRALYFSRAPIPFVRQSEDVALQAKYVAQHIGVSALRVDGLIASMQRVLNVESYAVLSVDSSQTLRLNLPLLREQFRLGDNNGR